MSVISSIVYSDKEAINAILELHCNNNRIDLDPCYSVGNFYNKTNIEEPIYKFDITPQLDGVDQADVRCLPLGDKSLNSVIFDPPFMFGGKNGPHGKQSSNKMAKRFTMFFNFDELENVYKGALSEFYRILNKKGIVAFKCQDYTDTKTTMTHSLVYRWATDIGFYAKDIFILIYPIRIYNSNKTQRHARKFHSYWWVFQK